MGWGHGFRRRMSGGLVLLLLFMQSCMAVYACPTELRTLQGEVELPTMPGCEGHMPGTMDADLPQLCKAHCQQGEQVVGTTPVGDWTPNPLLLAVIDWRESALSDVAPMHLWSSAPPGAVPPGSPPLYLSLLVLRN